MVVNYSWDQVIAWLGIVLPLAALAWSAFHYQRTKERENSRENFVRFFETLERVNNKDRSLILQKAAIFELRNYPEYKDVVVRICDDAASIFSTEDRRVLDEFRATASFLRAEND